MTSDASSSHERGCSRPFFDRRDDRRVSAFEIGDESIRLDVLRRVAVANDIFKPGKHDKNGSNGGPFAARFRRPVPSEPPPVETPAPAPPPGGAGTLIVPGAGTLIDAHGQVYVEG